MYNHITLKELRPQLPQVIGDIDRHLARYFISKRGRPVAVMLSIADYESFVESLNETQDKKNLTQIKKGIEEARTGKTTDWATLKLKYHV